MANCKSCGAEVVFVPNRQSGRPMILDREPAAAVVLLDSTMFLHGLVGFQVGPPDDSTVADVRFVYTDHHATCPKAAEWKGRTRADPPPQLDMAAPQHPED